MELWDVEDPTVSPQTVLLALCVGHAYPEEDFWYSFLLEAESTPAP
jgi:hypothetical protein